MHEVFEVVENLDAARGRAVARLGDGRHTGVYHRVGLGDGYLLFLESLGGFHLVKHHLGGLEVAHGDENVGHALLAACGYLYGTVDEREDYVHAALAAHALYVVHHVGVAPAQPHYHAAGDSYGDLFHQLIAEYLHIVAQMRAALLELFGH